MSTLIHASTNNDRWFLCCGDDDVADVFVLHEPNDPSGGIPERIELKNFLAHGTGSPENRALLGMIGAIVLSDRAVPTERVARPEPGAAGAEPTPGEEVTEI